MISNAVIVASLAVLAPAGPETPLSVANKLSAEYKKAMLKKDISHFEEGATSDFVYIDIKGQKMLKKPSIEGIKQSFKMMDIKRMDVKVVSARKAEGGILYVADTKLVGDMKMGGPKPAKGVMTMRDETLVVNKGGKWLYKRVKMLKDEITVDGKPMKM